jgi:thiamine-phosphate pyrophosphorylase
MNTIHEERMRRFLQARVYLVTSSSMSAGRGTTEIVTAALKGGIRLIQLREKDLPVEEFEKLARQVRRLTADAQALLIINDSLDVARAVGTDGVHLGQDDFPVAEARKRAPDLIIGASTHSVEEAVKAQRDGASYVNIGPLFPTSTKKWDGAFLGMDGLKKISAAISIPFTVMGGIKKLHIPELRAAGVRTVAVVTEITAAQDPEQAARDLLRMMAS